MAETSNGVNNGPRFPQNEEEAEQMFIDAHNRDPELIAQKAKEAYDSMIAVAEKLRLRKAQESGEGTTVVKVGEAKDEKQMPIETKVVQTQTQETTVSNDKSVVESKQEIIPPTGYMELPEGLYTWSPDIWGGRPLFGVPDRVIIKQDRPTIIQFILVQPAFGRNRKGQIVSLPEGAKVVVHAGVAWGPMLPAAQGPEGRPVIWAAPTTVDENTKKIRIANVGDKLHRYQTADGGYEYGLTILYDPDPKNPSLPRLISMETLRGVNE